MDGGRDPLGVEHVQAFADYRPLAFTYLQNAFAGRTPPDNCSSGDLPSGLLGL